MDKDLKRQKTILGFIIVILIICIIIIIALIGLLSENEEDENVLNTTEVTGENFEDTYGKTEDGGVDKSSYFDVMTCIRQYLSAINIKSDAYYTYDENGDYVLAVDEDEIKENIYNLLSQNYINQNEITIQNLYEKIETLESSVLFVPTEISMLQSSTIKSFAVYGLLESPIEYYVIDEIIIIVNLDIANNIYSIEPVYEEYNSIQEMEINKLETEIMANENNTFLTTYATNENSVNDYINLYKRLALGYPEKMYELLDEEYKIAKFGSLDGFKEYIEENKETIVGINIEKYQVTQNDDYTQYVCIDKNGHYYIIREMEVLNYTIILDIYTIDLPEFLEQYESASDEEKVLINIQRFFDAINDGDYEYAYSKLDETYKANNFGNQLAFENYVKLNFFDKNELVAGNVEQQGNTYLYSITIGDAKEEATNTITRTFVMQLKEGTDFVMSFSVE